MYRCTQSAYERLVCLVQLLLFLRLLLVAGEHRAQHYARTQQVLDAREQYLTRERLRDIRVGTRVVPLLALFG